MRIKVDFSDFFDDQRKLSVVNVNTEETTTVRDVLYKIILMFKLTPAAQKRRSTIDDVSKEKLEFGLFEEGFYIPPEETSTVLQDIGILKLRAVANTGEDDGEGKKKKRKRQKVEDEVEEDEDIEEYEIIPRKGRSKRNKLELEKNVKDRKGYQRRDSVETEEEVEEEEEDTRERKIRKKGKDSEETEGEKNDVEKKGRRKKEIINTGKREVRKGHQRRDSFETDDEEEDTRDRKIHRRREDSTETGGEEEEGNNGTKKSPRKREFVKYDKFEEEKVHRQKKGHQKKDYLQTEVDEDEEIIENEDNKRGNIQRGKKFKSGVHVTHTVSDDEEKIKKHKRKEKYQLEVENQDEEEMKSKKRNKRELMKDIISEAQPEEVDNIPHKDQKKEKKNKSRQVEEDEVTESLTQESRNKSAKLNELNRRSTRQILIEQYEEEPSSTDEQQLQRFQEKIVSTSCVIHVESNEEYESSSSGCCDRKDDCGKNMEADSALVSSVTGEPHCPRVKRKRKHNKGKKSQRQNINEDVSGPSQAHCNISQLRDCHFKNSSVSTSSQRSHIKFNTDDEEEVSSVSNSFDQGNDIEIVGTASGSNRGHYGKEGAFLVNSACSDEVNQRLLLETLYDGNFKSSTPKSNRKPPVIEIEGEDASALVPTSSDMPVITTNCVTRTFSQTKTVNEDCFATMKQMVEKKAITVVSISSSTNTVRTKPIKLPEVVPIMQRGPPQPVFIGKTTLSEETRNMFYDLLRLKNQIVPLVLRTPREAISNSVSDLEDSESDSLEAQNDLDICEVESCVAGTKDKSAQPLLSVSEEVSRTDEAKDSCEVLSIPSTSGYQENVEVLVDRPGAAAKNSRRGAPKSFQAVGSLLSDLRNPGTCHKSTELHEETDNDIQIETVHLSPVDEEEEKRDIAEVATKTDTEVTSTQGDARRPEEALDEEWHALQEKGETSGSSLGEPSSLASDSIPFSLDMEETQQLMEEMITETLKQDMTKDIKAATYKRDTRFLSQPILKTLPKIGEYIAIKVLSLDEKLRPIYSPYIAVKILKVVGLLVTVKIVDEKKSEDAQRVTNEDGVEEVDLTFDDEVDLTEDEQGEILELDWRDIHEPRHLYP